MNTRGARCQSIKSEVQIHLTRLAPRSNSSFARLSAVVVQLLCNCTSMQSKRLHPSYKLSVRIRNLVYVFFSVPDKFLSGVQSFLLLLLRSHWYMVYSQSTPERFSKNLLIPWYRSTNQKILHLIFKDFISSKHEHRLSHRGLCCVSTIK